MDRFEGKPGGEAATSDLRDEIVALEREVDRLAEAADRCERTMLASKLSVGAGGLAIVLLATGLLDPNALVLVVSVTAVLGGIALFGSTKATRDLTRAALTEREAQRSELIGRLDLQAMQQTDDVFGRRP